MNHSAFGSPAFMDGDVGPANLSHCAAKIIARWILGNLDHFCTADPTLEFPTSSEANQLIFNALLDEGPIRDECLLVMIKLFSQASISNLNLRRSTVTTETLRRCLLDHCWANKVSRLDLSETTEIGRGVFDVFANAVEPVLPHLDVLLLGSRPELLWCVLTSRQQLLHELSLTSKPEQFDLLDLGTLNPNLKALTLHGSQQGLNFVTQLELSVGQFFNRIMGTTPNLLYLDLTSWHFGSVQFLQVLKNLNTLVVHNVPLSEHDVHQICKLNTLKKLDLSQSRRANVEYPTPFVLLDQIITSLTELEFLDISGTNLADNPEPEYSRKWPEVLLGRVQSDIVGLRNLRRPLQYLGLFWHGACFYKRIPAEQVAGSADWDQVLMALSVHRDRVDMICNMFVDTWRVFNAYEHKGEREHKLKCLGHFATIMNNFLDEKMIQAGCSISTKFLLMSTLKRVDSVHEVPAGLRRRLANVLTRSLERHLSEPDICTNLCASLRFLRLPHNVAPDMFIRLLSVLLRGIKLHRENESLLKDFCMVLKSLVVWTSIEMKKQAGTAGAVRTCMETISLRIGSPPDGTMEQLWSILVSLTDECPDNLECFFSYGGMDAFYKAFAVFKSSTEIVWDMAIVMANSAEIPHLADRLLRQDYLQIFIEMLDLDLSPEDLGTSYIAAGILSNLMTRVCLTAEPESSWNLVCPQCPYQDTVNKIFNTIDMWDLAAEHMGFYVSFRPIILLLANDSCRIAQVYGAFALAHRTNCNAGSFLESYRDLVKRPCQTGRGTATLSNDLVKREGALRPCQTTLSSGKGHCLIFIGLSRTSGMRTVPC